MAEPLDVKDVRQEISRLYGLDLTVSTPSNPGPTLASAIIHNQLANIPKTQAIPSLEQFNFGDVAPDVGLSSRLIEQNLDDAVKYAHTCGSLRAEYGTAAKLYLDTAIKSEEFFRLEDVHDREVDAGLYSLPYDEASEDAKALNSALAEAAAQKAILDAMYSAAPPNSNPAYAGTLTDTAVGLYSDQTAALASLSASQNKPDIKSATKTISQYRTALEDASWKYNLRAITTNTAQLSGRLAVAQLKQTYLQKDIGFRAERAAVSLKMAYKQLAANTTPNAPLNYSERLDAIRDLFGMALTKLIQRILVLRQGTKDIYGIDLSFSSPEKGKILDEIAKYLLLLQDEVAKVRRRQRVSIFTLLLSRFAPAGTSITDAIKSPSGLTVDVVQSDSSSQTGLLRGIAFEYIGSTTVPSKLTVVPPVGATSRLSTAGAALPLIVGRVLSVAASLDIRPQFADALWNGNPYSAWKINSDPNWNDAGITDIAMHLWLAY